MDKNIINQIENDVNKMMAKFAFMAKNPLELREELSPTNFDREILRIAVTAELDAISLYEQQANMTSNEKMKKVLLDIAREEKTHVGELQALLSEIDDEHMQELEEGKKEVEEKTGK